jgi:DNA-directed RNA polymerase III subunit RPC2
MKAMGCQSDKEVLQLICGNDEGFHSDFAINLEDAALCVSLSPGPSAG